MQSLPELFTDFELREEEVRLQAVQRELRELEHAASELQNQVHTCKSRELDHHRQKKALQLALQRASANVDRLEGELSEATPDAAQIEVLEAQLEETKDELKRVGDVYVDVEARKAELDGENKINKQEMDRAAKAVKELQQRSTKAQELKQKLNGTREDRLLQKNKAFTAIEKAREFRQPWVEEVDEVKKQLEKTIADTEKICPDRVPVPNGKTAEYLTNTLTRLQATRKQTEKELGGSEDELLRKANEAKKMHMDAMREFEDIRNVRNVSQVVRIAMMFC
jgi:chromosome segregation ATPase